MRRPLISVIVPVYNVERYLSRCIDSILAQTYEDLEIILVDDGSTDSSGQICEAYAETDPRIRTLHKQNGGMSDARNAGIQAASGEYGTFVDSDDYIAEDCIEYLYEMTSANNAQIAVCGYQKVYEGTSGGIPGGNGAGNAMKPEGEKAITVCGSENALSRLLYQQGIIASVWGKLYQRDLFSAIRFPKGKWHEDAAVMYQLFDNARVIAVGNDKKYYYVQRQGSITNSAFDVRRMDYIQFTRDCIGYMGEKHPNLEAAAISRHFSACFELLAAMGKDKKFFLNEYNILIKEIKAYRKTVLFDANARAMNRVAAMGTYISITVLRKLCCVMTRP